MIYDLSIKISNHLPTYPGDPKVSLKKVADCESISCNITSVSIGTHSGTHVDLPLHYIKDGTDAASMPLESFCGDAVVIEALYERGMPIGPDVINESELRKGDILIIRTGWEEKAGTSEFFEDFPHFDIRFADKLIAMGIKAVGTDLPSVDGAGTGGIVHKKLLSNNIVIIEALVNLKPLVNTRIYFSAVPLKIENGDGSPVRAYAML
ncbi:MAG: cyclase family protein [Ruminiclostridium sp.]|nr:cyclase family protein [Ruminiclostridium sp.]